MLRLLALLTVLPGLALAQPTYDFTLEYAARDTVEVGDAFGVDNDRFIGTLGAAWTHGAGGTRAALTLGVRNEYFEGPYPIEVEVEGAHYRADDRVLTGFGGRVGGVEGRAFHAEIGAVGEIRGDYWTARAYAGGQKLTAEWPNADGRLDGFVTTEGTLYPADWLLVRAGASLESRGQPMAHIGGEIRPFGPLSAYADFVVADRFRDEAFYNDFRFGLQLSFGFPSLRERDRAQNLRLLWRPVAAQ